MKKTQTYRQLIKSSDILACPVIYDCISAKVAESMGFKAIAISGSGIANSFLGKPDIGLLTLSENLTVTRNIVRAVDIPVTGDADTGYGNAINVYYTVELFEEAGVVGINIEDQVFPKRCGHMKGKQIIPQEEMVKKIEAAVSARKNPDFAITARTDAATYLGVDEAIKRAKAYIDAGADVVYPDGILSENDIKRFVESVDAPVRINVGLVMRKRPTTPLISFKKLEELGVSVASFARMITAASITGLRNAFAVVQESMEKGVVIERPDLVEGFEQITDLMGLPKFLEMEKQFLTEETLKEKYGLE
jgi:2-methylisocitrate lyase-like PEP mutase family enzyme